MTFIDVVEETKPIVDFSKDGDPSTDIGRGQRYETFAISGQTVVYQEMLDGACSEFCHSLRLARRIVRVVPSANDFQGVGSAPYLTTVVHPRSEPSVTSTIDKAGKISQEGILIKVFFMEAVVVEDRNQIGDML